MLIIGTMSVIGILVEYSNMAMVWILQSSNSTSGNLPDRFICIYGNKICAEIYMWNIAAIGDKHF